MPDCATVVPIASPGGRHGVFDRFPLPPADAPAVPSSDGELLAAGVASPAPRKAPWPGVRPGSRGWVVPPADGDALVEGGEDERK